MNGTRWATIWFLITLPCAGGWVLWMAVVVSGGTPDPRHKGKHPELKDKAIVPDVLLQAHNASLGITFYEGKQFPAEYQGDIFFRTTWILE